VTPRNLAPGLGYSNIYEPRIYGFRVSEVAKTGPRMKWLRSKPADANELDESALWAAQQAAKTAGTPIDADMPDQSQEVGGEIEDEDMEGAESGVVGVGEIAGSGSGKAAKGRRRENGDVALVESGNGGGGGGAAVRPAGAGS
jgi:casein kinase II subunit beta